MTYSLTIEIPRLPKMNSSDRHNRWTEIREKQLWETEVFVAARMKRPYRPLERATITYTRRSTKEPDHDNLVASFKHVQDGLIKAGIIIDDKPEVIGQPTYSWEKASPKNGSVVIQVEERA